MPFFGIVCVASWVGCFFSAQDLLKAPNHSSFRSPQAAASGHSRLSPVPLISAISPTPPIANQSPLLRLQSILPLQWLKSGVLQPLDQMVSVSYTPARASMPPAPRSFASNPVVSLAQTLLWGMRLVAGVPRSRRSSQSISVAPVSGDDRAISDRAISAPVNPCLFRGARSGKAFQVRMKEYLVAETATSQQASQIAQQLKTLVRSGLDAAHIQPGLVNGVLVGKIHDRVLFQVDRAVAANWNCNAELLTVQWVNNLRTALDEAPLLLAEAQERLHNLHETRSQLTGTASWYGPGFHGKQTATGETYDQTQLTAAHPSLPFDTYLKVTNLNNDRSVIVRVNDRGPYFENRVLDLSWEAARSLNSEATGVVPIRAVVMQSGTAAPATPTPSPPIPSTPAPSLPLPSAEVAVLR